MAKRLGNFATVREVLDEGASPAALRYLLAARTHYRKPLDYSDELLADSNEAVQRLVDVPGARRRPAHGGGGRRP